MIFRYWHWLEYHHVITTSSEKDDITYTKWKVYSCFHCEFDYREWEDVLIARHRLKRVDYLMTDAYANLETPSHSVATANAAKLILQKDYSLAWAKWTYDRRS